MARRMVFAAAISLLLSVVPTVALGSSSRIATNSQTYPDSTGEDPAAPDITSVVVSNDNSGTITFQVNISNRPTFTPDMLLDIYLDTDRNPGTGSSQAFGADDVIELQPGSVGLFQWNGTDFVGAASQSSLVYSYSAAGATIKVSALDLKRTKGFNFAVDVASGITVDASGNDDFTNVHDDRAPDPGHGTFAYDVRVVVTLTAGAFSISPSPARAGKPLSAGLAVTESDTNAGITEGAISCAAKIAGKPVKVKARRLVEGVAVCVWSVPKTARGKTLRGSISVSSQGAQTARSFSTKIIG